MRQIFNKAMVLGMFKGQNPIKGVKLPTLQNARERFLSFDEAQNLLTALKAKSKTVHDMAVISLHCGLRFGEIADLKSQDLDFQNGFITVMNPKNKQSRKAFMTKLVRQILKERVSSEPDAFVFPDKVNKGRVNHVSRTFGMVVTTLGLNKGVKDPRQRVTFHTLRHSYASWLALQGEQLLTIRELLGHKSFEMTKRYAHLIPDEKRKATLRLEQRFEESNNGNSDIIKRG
jgi:integrase